MNAGKLVFSQVMDLVDPTQFARCVKRYPMPRSSRSFSARDQCLAMAFAQMTFREGLRDIEACLKNSQHLYAMGIRGNVTRTNLAYANEHRDWRVYENLAQVLIRKTRLLYADDATGLDLSEIVYAVDASTIDLCLSLFPWATFKSTKAAVKLHTMIDLHGSIPVFISITEGNVHDVNFLDQIHFEPGSIYVMDRGYVDFQRLFRIHSSRASFVTRAKSNMSFYVVSSAKVDSESGISCDQTIRLKSAKSKRQYPESLRRIRYRDPETGKWLVFLTNNFTLPALTVAAIYKRRWEIVPSLRRHQPLFFKWIKQNLRIKVFFGLTENAVPTQIWIATCVYLMVACLNKVHQITESLSRTLQILSVNVFQKDVISQLFIKPDTRNCEHETNNQLVFNGF